MNRWILGVSLLTLVGCGDDPIATTEHIDPYGHVMVTILSGGATFDADGFTLMVDGEPWARVDVDGPLTIRLPTHRSPVALDLGDVAPHCDNRSGMTTVRVRSGRVVSAQFLVDCEAPPDLSGRELMLSRRGSAGTLLRTTTEGAGSRELQDPFAVGRRPAVSYDGTSVAHLVDGVVHVTPLDGGPTRVVEIAADVGGGVASVSWSPDGTRLIFAAGLDWYWWGGGPIGIAHLATDSVDWLVDASGEAVVGSDPAWSPSGEHIALGIHWTSVPGLYTLELPAVIPLAVGSFGHAPVWSPDGARIAYALGPDAKLVTLDVAGTTDLALGGPGLQWEPQDWSADGRYLLLVGEGETRSELYAVRISDGARFRLTVSGDVEAGVFLDAHVGP